jgi:hypothetical protein
VTDAELVQAAAGLRLSSDRQRSSQEQRAAIYLDRLAEQVRERAEVEAYVAGRLREVQAEQARQAEQERIDREDPITTLPLSLTPSADDDIVMLSPNGVYPEGSPDFRLDGKRVRYGRHGLPVACAPAAHHPEQKSRFPASRFDDLVGLYEVAAAKDAASDTLLTPKRDTWPPVEWAVAIVEATTDKRMFPILARWHRFAEGNAAMEGRSTLAEKIRAHLNQNGGLHLIEDEAAELAKQENRKLRW